jgi:hypothetical protein
VRVARVRVKGMCQGRGNCEAPLGRGILRGDGKTRADGHEEELRQVSKVDGLWTERETREEDLAGPAEIVGVVERLHELEGDLSRNAEEEDRKEKKARKVTGSKSHDGHSDLIFIGLHLEVVLVA